MIKKIETKHCEICQKELKHWASVSIRITNPWHVYKGSGRPFVSTWSFKFCKKDLAKFLKLIHEFIIK
jgi:hypothetical protein